MLTSPQHQGLNTAQQIAVLSCLLLGSSLAGCADAEHPARPQVDAGDGTRSDARIDSSVVVDGGAPDLRGSFRGFSPTPFPGPAEDISNAWADDLDAAALGQALFFDTRFSGPLLASEHNGAPTGSGLGFQGEPGKVACVSCHIPSSGFVDTRSTKQQVSLGVGWTHRRAPSLIGVAQAKLLMWDGRRDAGYNQVFTPLETAVEMNSSRLFVAQQMQRFYKEPYEKIFGAFPDISSFDELAAEDAGCAEFPTGDLTGCEKPFDDNVTRVVVNFGKAINAYLRQLECGPGRFDAWMQGDDDAINDSERRGAALFAGRAACIGCHQGVFFTDQRFHNLGLPYATVSLIIAVGDDPGAAIGIPAALQDPLNVRGEFSDGDDGRLDAYDNVDPETLLGRFRTPSLRCAAERPSYMHTGQFRSLEELMEFFDRGGSEHGYVGEREISPLGLSQEEKDDLIAFLGTLSGEGPATEFLTAPTVETP